MDNRQFKNTISVSQMGAFQDCQYKWSLMYKENIRTRRGDITASSIGSIAHEGMSGALHELYALRNRKMKPATKLVKVLQAAYKAIDAWALINKSEDKVLPVLSGNDDGSIAFVPDETYEQEWRDMVATAKLVVERTVANLDLVNRYDVVAYEGTPLIEYWLNVDLSEELGFEAGSYGFVGVVDAVLYDKQTGAIAVFDWKLHARFTTLENEQLNAQIALYQHALRTKYGINATLGVVYQIKRDPPRKPTLNLNGTMSRRAITSDWPTYEAALVEAGLNPEDYREEMQPKLSSAEFFRPLMVFRTAEITQIFWDNLVSFALTIIQAAHFPMALGYSCRTCSFAALCNARIYGLDEEALFEDKYEFTDKVDPLIVDELEEAIGD